MDNVIGQLNNLQNLAFSSNKYQIIITILFVFQIICCEFFKISLPYLTTQPYIYDYITKDSIKLTYEYCSNYNLSNNDILSIIDKSRFKNNILEDFELYCSKWKTESILFLSNIGMMVGGIFAYKLIDILGRKKNYIIITPFYIVIVISFFFIKGKNLLWLFLIFIFFLGFFSYILVITIIIYTCDLVNRKYFPLFITVILSGMPLSGVINDICFYYVFDNWRYNLIIFSSVNLLVYFICLFYLVESPKFYLNSRHFDLFQKALTKIAKINNITIDEKNFIELRKYYPKEENLEALNTMVKLNSQKEKFLDALNRKQNLYIDDSEDEEKKEIQEEIRTQIKRQKKKELEKEEKMKKKLKERGEMRTSSVDNLKDLVQPNKTNNINNNNNHKSDNIYEQIDLLVFQKEEELELFTIYYLGVFRYIDYSPIDLLKISSQRKIFCILSYLWCMTLLIKSSFSINNKYFSVKKNFSKYDIISDVCEFGGFYLVLLCISLTKLSILSTHILFQVISIVLLMFFLLNNDNYIETKFLPLFFLCKISWSSFFITLYIIATIIYPSLLRTKGLGLNKALGRIGSILSPIFINNLSFDNIICYYLIISFFGLVFSFGLPKRIGQFLSVSNKSIEEQNKKFLTNRGSFDSAIENKFKRKMNKLLQGTSITKELELFKVKNKTEESESDDIENDTKSKTSSKRTLLKKKRNSIVKKSIIEMFNNNNSPSSPFPTSSSSKNLNSFRGMILNKNQSSTSSSNSEKNKEIKEVIKEEDEDLDKNLSVPDEKNCQNEILSKIK